MNKIMPDSTAEGQEQPTDGEAELTDDEDDAPQEQPQSKLHRLRESITSWLLGEKPRQVDLEDINEAKGVTAFAKELMPALYKASTSPAVLLSVKLLMFIGLNVLLVAMLFIYPRLNTYTYLAGQHQIEDGVAVYQLHNSSFYAKVSLVADDMWDKPPPEGNEGQLAEYDELVSLSFDAAGDPGWNLQDLLDLPRAFDAELAYSSTVAGGRMVQDYRRCSRNCLDASGQPADLNSRDTTVVPYGEFGDFYVRRELLLAAVDSDFYQQFMNASLTAELRGSRGNYGFDVSTLDAAASAATLLSSTVPSDSGFLCNLGQPRKRLQAIRILSRACYVQVVSAPGAGYQLYMRTHKEGSVTAAVSQTETTNTTSGCPSYTLDITAQADTCQPPQLVGVDPGCEASCAVVLFKGVNARHVPIRVEESPIAGPWPSTLLIHDKYLVLSDLQVTGGSIAVNISAARISNVAVQTAEGAITLDHARVDAASINSTTDNIVIEDDRDTELQYRSGGNLLCAAAPLVEATPDAFMGCNNAAGRPRPHDWYESVQDGLIDRDEFAAGLARMGLSYASSSLDLDEAQQAQLLGVLFKDTPSAPASDRVTLDVFDANLLAVKGLDSMADTYMLLDPWCYNGRLLKIRPGYTADAFDTPARIAAAAMLLDGNGVVLDTRMPAYLKTASAPDMNPCPTDWGNGIQGSTNYSHFAWANASIGFKWGKALPSWCLDETWPGTFPDDAQVYGALAGQAVLPGCEPSACKPLYRILAQSGSVHVQVLPYQQDVWNATGLYQTMIGNCEDGDGQLRCFYKGWADGKDASLHPKDEVDWQTTMDPCYADSMDCSDTVQAVTATGHGIPMHEKWFWSSRKVYMELEPAWYLIMSATLLKPDINHVRLRFSPGYCNPQLGAVEHIDWRHPSQHDALLHLGSSTASGVTQLSAGSAAAGGNRVDPRDPVLAQQGIRAARDKQVYDRMVACINGTAPDRTGWFLKQNWRQDYENESLVLSAVTADGQLDTSPGHVDAAGRLIGQGPFFRHRRVCVAGRNCQRDYVIYRDTCKVPRLATFDPATNRAVLSPCTFPDGSSAWSDRLLADAGSAFNDTSYQAQFPTSVDEYSLAQAHELTGDGLLDQAQLADANSHAWDNVTTMAYSKWLLQEADNGDLQLADSTNGWMTHTPLYAAVILSLVIAIMCSLLVVMMLVFAGLGMLNKINKDLQARAKIELAVLEERKAAMFAEVLEKKRLMVRQARRGEACTGSKLDQNLLAGGKASPDACDVARLPPLPAAAVAAVMKPPPKGGAPIDADAVFLSAEDVFLTEAEKTEILRVWDDRGFSEADFRGWEKAELLQAWQEAVTERNLPAGNPTLLPDNVPHSTVNFSKLSSYMTKNGFALRRPRAEIAINDKGPFKPTKSKTLDATELAADPVKLHKVESKLRYEETMNKLQRQYSSRRGSKEQQKLLVNSGSEKPAAKPDPSTLGWRVKLQQALAMNLERGRRLLERIVQLCMISLPSPFQVIDSAVVDLFQSMWVDSFATFLQVKCLFDHDMEPKEEILLGNCEQARTDLSNAAATAAARTSGAGTKPASTAITSGAKSTAGSTSGTQGVAAEAGPQIEVDGEGDVLACEAVDGKKEVYRTKYVRVFLRSHVAMVPASDEDDTDSDDSDDDDSGASYAGAACAVAVAGMAVKNGTHCESGITAWSKSLGKTFKQATAVLGIAGNDAADAAGGVLMRRRRQWEVLIEEGPGLVSSSTYKPELEPQVQRGSVPGSLPGGESSKLLKRRTIRLPCASKRELQQATKQELVMDTAVRVRHYLVQTKTGRCVITINTMPDAAAAGGKQWLPGGKYMAPRVLFAMPLSTFAPEYEKFCMQTKLQTKDVLTSTDVLNKFNISMKKRIVALMKGLKQKAANVDSPEELAAMAQDSMYFPGQAGGAVLPYDVEEDKPRSKAPLPPIHAYAGHRETGALPILQPGAIPSFPGTAAAHPAAGEQQEHSEAGSLQQRQPLLQSQPQRSTMKGDSSDEEEADQVPLLAAQRSLLGLAGNAAKPSSRRTTGNAPTTEAEAKAAIKADRKRPASKLQDLLQASQEPLAVFLRDTYDVTANYVSDAVELDVMQRQFRRWHRAAKPAASVSVPGATAPQLAIKLAASLAGGGVAKEASTAALAAVVAPAAAAPKQYPSGDEVAVFGFKHQQQPEYTMFGVLVNQQDFSDDPRDANPTVYMLAELVSVVLHTLFIWLLPMPLFVIAFGFQGYYDTTTSIQPLITLDEFRLHPLTHIQLESVFPLIRAMVRGGIVSVLVGYVKLLAHYLLAAYKDRPWRAVVKTLFWAYLTVLVGVLVAYFFEVFCWVILGAVINPNKFLPYSVAAVTLVAHSKATWGRLISKFNSYRESLSSSVLEAFAGKISAAEEATAQTDSLLQAQLAEAVSSVRAAASLSGNAGEEGDQEGSTDHAAVAGLMGGALGAVGMGMMGVVAGSALASKSTAKKMWPGLRRSTAGSDSSDDEEGKGAAGAAARGSNAGRAAHASAAPSKQGSQVWGPAAARSASSSGSGAKPAAAAPAAAAQAAGSSSGGKGSSKGDALECYSMFQMFASGDDSLDYSEFCALLEHLDIRLLEDKRRKLFALIDKSADGHIGYQEFQDGFELLKEQIVERHMAKAGVTMGRLLFLLAYAIVVLLLIFVFIFLGVAAFTGANTMGAVVNSCMTAGAGLAMNLGGGDDGDDDDDDEEVDISDA